MSGFGLTNCTTCDREFETSLTDGSYFIKNANRTMHESWPDKEECDFCEGEDTCSEEGCTAQATVFDKEGQEGYCAPCWKKCCEENDETVEECEEFVVRLEENRHDKPKGGK